LRAQKLDEEMRKKTQEKPTFTLEDDTSFADRHIYMKIFVFTGAFFYICYKTHMKVLERFKLREARVAGKLDEYLE
jgi:hypothetical protein